MKIIKILTIAVLLTATGLIAAAFIDSKPVSKKMSPAADSKGFAVVELFTSEGCSSCPSADAVVAKIEKESEGKPVYILAYHVDYWNRLGWKDVFSSADYSHRQSTYAAWLKQRSVYTPQVIVNGRTEFVGSQEGTLRNAIRTSLDKAGKAQLSLVNTKTSDNQASFKYNAEGAAGNTLVLALVQKHATTVVKNGENGGRTLSHVQIVTKINTTTLNSNTGEARIDLPKNFTATGYEVIAFLQNPSTGEILAATRPALSATVSAAN